MKKKINIVDYLGAHCGMHYYLEAMKKVIAGAGDFDVNIMSNFSPTPSAPAFFKNQYQGSKLKKGLSLLTNLTRLKKYVARHPAEIYIYLTYGNHIDVPFINIISKAPFHLVDIHEVIAQNLDTNQGLKNKFRNQYASRIKSVISHSSRTDDFLREFGFSGSRLSVPHFRYVFPRQFDAAAIPEEIKNAPAKDKINLLFFGNLNENKGIDILMDAINRLDESTASKLNLIVAGKDFDGSVDRVPLKDHRIAHIFKRHISDDELRFLYQNADYLCLPYRKTSQSGILEMAFYFKKPIIASDLPYFRTTLEEFPSFGILTGIGAQEYADALKKVVEDHGKKDFYTEADYSSYENRKEIEDFKGDFNTFVNSLK
ncbi:MAG: glycosyltransferase [Muribaculaceae bacterium]|nr:glycosyltransferase [Muribaculaceae bacterium]